MFKLQWDASLSPVKTKKNECQNDTRNVHYSENLPRVKTAHLYAAQLFDFREGLDVNTSCSPTTRCFYLYTRKSKHTSPHQTTQQHWLHSYSGAPPIHSMLKKIRVKTESQGRPQVFLFFFFRGVGSDLAHLTWDFGTALAVPCRHLFFSFILVL